MSHPFMISGCEYVCNVPPELGAVTGLEMSHGRVLARTESGISMIIPSPDNSAKFSDDVQLPSGTEPNESA